MPRLSYSSYTVPITKVTKGEVGCCKRQASREQQ